MTKGGGEGDHASGVRMVTCQISARGQRSVNNDKGVEGEQ